MRALLALVTLIGACSVAADVPTTTPATHAALSTAIPSLPFPPPPSAPSGPLDPAATTTLDHLWEDLGGGRIDTAHIDALADSGDPRIAWLLADLLRFVLDPGASDAMVMAASELTGVEFSATATWVTITDHLLAWDTPAFPGYSDYKRRLYGLLEPRWEPFLTEPNDIDERWISWGGVGIDARPLGDRDPCPLGCIPALDDPGVTDAPGGAWYPDDGVVFGVVVDGETRAYPRHIMETHELVNDTLGGRRVGLPYCTLCGSAQLFYLDETIVLRTSGLLNRSNKVMYDLESESGFDTFTGRAVSGPLWEEGVVLEQGSVVTTTWGAWRAEHPHTTIVAQDGGIGRTYDPDPLRGRDDQGPIFPIGDRDLRLAVQAQVLGVISSDGVPVAFPVAEALAVLEDGETVEQAGVRVISNGGGLAATTTDGVPLASHQAFWFAWSQFHPDTVLWRASG